MKPGHGVSKQCIRKPLSVELEVSGEKEAGRWTRALKRCSKMQLRARSELPVAMDMIKSLDTPAQSADSTLDTTTPAFP